MPNRPKNLSIFTQDQVGRESCRASVPSESTKPKKKADALGAYPWIVDAADKPFEEIALADFIEPGAGRTAYM